MGALPKRRISSQRKGKRRANHKIKKPTLTACPSCGKPKKPHHACPHCGVYRQQK